MYVKAYLLALVTCVLCLITLQYLWGNEEGGRDLLQSDKDFFSGGKENDIFPQTISGEVSAKIMGDNHNGSSRKNSSRSEESSNSNGDLKSAEKNDHFDILQLNKHLITAIRKTDNEVDMDEYILVFQQLYKFFFMLGTVFGFVGSDVKAKLEILQGYRNSENKSHYETIEKMLAWEKETDYIHTNKESSGSRTLLRLHRALNFVSKFLAKVDEIKDSEGLAHVCKESYAQTLSKFHPWLIQKGANLAMYALPTKKELIHRVCDGRIESEEVRKLLHDVIASTEKVYEKCQEAYSEQELLDLP